MGYIREWMPIQNAFEIGHETQPTRDLSQATKEDSGEWHIGARTEVFRVTRIADDGFGCYAAQLKGGGRHAGRADRDIGRIWDLIETCCDFYLGSIGLQLGCKSLKPLRIASAKNHAFDERRQAAGIAGTHIS